MGNNYFLKVELKHFIYQTENAQAVLKEKLIKV